MRVMAKRKPANRTGVPFGGFLDPAIAAALDAYVDGVRPKTTKTSVIEMLLERFLTEQGLLPAKPPPDQAGK